MKCSRCNGSGVEPESVAVERATDDWFEQFWVECGRVGPRKKAHECFVSAVKRGHAPEVILHGLRRWVRYWNSPGAAAQKWPQGFLNQEYFLDAPPPIRSPRKVMPGRAGIEAALARATDRGVDSSPLGELGGES